MKAKVLVVNSNQSTSVTFWSHMHIEWGHFQLPQAMRATSSIGSELDIITVL